MSQTIGVFTLNPGGSAYVNNVTTAGVIKGNTAVPGATPGKLRRVHVIAPGTTSGSFTFYDCNFIGAYSGTTTYYPGQGVTSGGNVYVNILSSTGIATSNATYWTQLNPVTQLPYNAINVYAGAVIDVSIPFYNGIYLGAVPTAGSPVLVVAYD
jgi:hypothetical protein